MSKREVLRGKERPLESNQGKMGINVPFVRRGHADSCYRKESLEVKSKKEARGRGTGKNGNWRSKTQ